MTFKSPLGTVFPGLRGSIESALGALPLYYQKVMGLNPIAYWPLWEAAGLTAEDLINSPAQDGIYSSDVSTWPVGAGIGDENTAPILDGTNDFVNVYSVPFRTAFDGDTGSVSTWVFPSNWPDGVNKYIINFGVDAANWFDIRKSGINFLRFTANCNGGFGAYQYAVPLAERTVWLNLCMTWNWGGVNTEVKCYVQADLKNTFNAAGQFAGLLAPTSTVIGAATTGPVAPFEGRIAHVPVFDQTLAQPAITALATV